MSTLTIQSPVPTEARPREVVRCRKCLLVQFRTISELCRRCDYPLPPPPRLDLAFTDPASEAQSEATSAARTGRSGLHSRTKTARELTIGRKLRELRDHRQLTQQDMAVKAGVPRTYISRIENARLLPGPVMLRRIADALQVTILDLLPQNKAGNCSIEADPYWAALAESFVQLREHEMRLVLEHVRSILGESHGNGEYAAVPLEMAR